MTIDNVIEKYKNKAKQASKSIDRMEHINVKEYQQIAEWLEELKELKEGGTDE